MAPMKNKDKIINNEAEPSAAASKRRRIEPRNTTSIGGTTNLPLSFPAATPQIPVEKPAGDDYDDDAFSSLITQQNFIIDYHMNQMQLNVEEFLRRNFADELNKRKEIEAKLIQKDEQMGRFREMYNFYEKRAFLLEEMLQQKVGGDGGGTSATAAVTPEEEVESCNIVDLNSTESKMEMACKNCRSRRATMLWLPCRHVCVCLVCERRVKACPICCDRKTESFMVITG